MRVTTVFTVLLILLTAVSLMAIRAEDYFPLGIGNTWTTQDSSAEWVDTTTTTIVGMATVLGYESFVSIETREDGPDTFYFQLRSDGLYGVSYEDEGFVMEIKYMPRNFSFGDNWLMFSMDTAWSDGGMDFDQTFTMSATAVSYESQTVPAGHFGSCLKLQSSGEMTFLVSMEGMPVYSSTYIFGSTMWLGEDIGIVKIIDWNIEEEGDTTWDYSVLLTYSLSNIAENISKPDNSGIHTWPNPFNSACKIATPSGAEVEIFDVAGRLVATLPASMEKIRSWTPSEDVSGGVYLIRATVGDERITSKVLFVK